VPPAPDLTSPLGVFDSGVGGLTVVRALRQLLPHESLIYLGDTARVPYGSKSPDTIRRFALEDTQFLIQQGVKAVVVACNTATAHALDTLRATFRVPIFGVLEPGIEATLAAPNCQRVGIIGTEGTIKSHAYQHHLALRRPDLQIHARATPLLVPFIEQGWTDHPALKLVLKEYLQPMLLRQIDTLLLGCTHYPLLIPQLQTLVGDRVRLIDSATTCATHVRDHLAAQNLLAPPPAADSASAPPSLVLHLTDLSEQAEDQAHNFLGIPLTAIHHATL
jgi:glutamate racemase